MARHADMGSGETCERRLLHACVAIEATNAKLAKVMLVAEGNRLIPDDILPGHVRRMHNPISHADGSEGHECPGKQNRAGNDVRARPE